LVHGVGGSIATATCKAGDGAIDDDEGGAPKPRMGEAAHSFASFARAMPASPRAHSSARLSQLGPLRFASAASPCDGRREGNKQGGLSGSARGVVIDAGLLALAPAEAGGTSTTARPGGGRGSDFTGRA
jgi:hypothetical protein